MTVLSLHLQIKSNSNKKNIDKSNKIDNDIDFVTHNRYAPLENIDESFNSGSGDNLILSEINAATQVQVNNNCRRHERKKALIIGDSMVKGIKRWKINKKLKFTNAYVNYFPGANTSNISIIPRGDQLHQKAFNVNKELKELCASDNIRYIKHGNIHPRNYLN